MSKPLAYGSLLGMMNRLMAGAGLVDPIPGRCPSTMQDCRCGLDPGHDGPHQCVGPRDVPFPLGCLGEWHGNDHEPELARGHRLPTGGLVPHTCPDGTRVELYVD